jgi:hypothetical protein
VADPERAAQQAIFSVIDLRHDPAGGPISATLPADQRDPAPAAVAFSDRHARAKGAAEFSAPRALVRVVAEYNAQHAQAKVEAVFNDRHDREKAAGEFNGPTDPTVVVVDPTVPADQAKTAVEFLQSDQAIDSRTAVPMTAFPIAVPMIAFRIAAPVARARAAVASDGPVTIGATGRTIIDPIEFLIGINGTIGGGIIASKSITIGTTIGGTTAGITGTAVTGGAVITTSTGAGGTRPISTIGATPPGPS